MTSTETRALTWNQRRALQNLAKRWPVSCRPKDIADAPAAGGMYLCRGSAKTAVYALVRKGLAECTNAGSPMRYRLTPPGIDAALSEEG